jgi:hypothetical protein
LAKQPSSQIIQQHFRRLAGRDVEALGLVYKTAMRMGVRQLGVCGGVG